MEVRRDEPIDANDIIAASSLESNLLSSGGLSKVSHR